jgi:hypothetical protein
MQVDRCTTVDMEEWLALRRTLWPRTPEPRHRDDVATILARPDQAIAFLVRMPGEEAFGFAEATLP